MRADLRFIFSDAVQTDKRSYERAEIKKISHEETFLPMKKRRIGKYRNIRARQVKPGPKIISKIIEKNIGNRLDDLRSELAAAYIPRTGMNYFLNNVVVDAEGVIVGNLNDERFYFYRLGARIFKTRDRYSIGKDYPLAFKDGKYYASHNEMRCKRESTALFLGNGRCLTLGFF